jgi:hypothetical protein
MARKQDQKMQLTIFQFRNLLRSIVIVYSSHPSIYVFLEVILDQQATTYIKMRNMTEQAPQPRIEREKTDFAGYSSF